MTISVVINTYDSAEYLDKVLESVKGFDEVIICDMESTDETVEIARRHGVRSVRFSRRDHTCVDPARNYAISEANSDWVLIVDPDEIVPAALREYLYRYIKKKNSAEGLYIPRRNYILDRFRSAKYPDYQLRFFRNGAVNWPPVVNAVPEVTGKIGKIPANKRELALIHLPHKISYQIDFLNAFTSAEVTKTPDKRVSLAGLMFHPFASFFSSYILRGGFTYGIPGFIAASHDAVYKFYRDAKIYESRVKAKLPGEIDEAEPQNDK